MKSCNAKDGLIPMTRKTFLESFEKEHQEFKGVLTINSNGFKRAFENLKKELKIHHRPRKS